MFSRNRKHAMAFAARNLIEDDSNAKHGRFLSLLLQLQSEQSAPQSRRAASCALADHQRSVCIDCSNFHLHGMLAHAFQRQVRLQCEDREGFHLFGSLKSFDAPISKLFLC